MAIKLKVWGDYACFTRPEMKVERVSYDVMTPSAARGVLEAIYWHPGMKWIIDKITVLNEIQFDSIRRNEVKNKATVGNNPQNSKKDLHLYVNNNRTQRNTLLLRNVAYIIHAHFDIVPKKMGERDSAGKYSEQFNRRAKRGQCFYQPYLGCREFSAKFEWVEKELPISFYNNIEQKDFGFMLHDIDYQKKINVKGKEEYLLEPHFYRCVMENGTISVPKLKSREVFL